MSGTSLDGIDAVIVEISPNTPCKLIDSLFLPFEASLKDQLQSIIGTQTISIEQLGSLDRAFSIACASIVNQLIDKSSIDKSAIQAIGSHGLTVYHAPELAQQQPNKLPFTMQIGDPSTLAALTQLPVVADFRRADIAKDGQGAPLVPPFHAALFEAHAPCSVLNIGGIANISVVTKDTVYGFDTGPGNCLMDSWIQKNLDVSYDKDGSWAASGSVNEELLESLLSDEYFAKPYPKSTGKEYFNLDWLEQRTGKLKTSKEDVQATLLHTTAISIVNSIQSIVAQTIPENKGIPIFVCGGGAQNTHLMNQLAASAPEHHWQTTGAIDIHPDWIEACAFAWLAYRRWHQLPSNEPRVTGASGYVSLGGIYLA